MNIISLQNLEHYHQKPLEMILESEKEAKKVYKMLESLKFRNRIKMTLNIGNETIKMKQDSKLNSNIFNNQL